MGIKTIPLSRLEADPQRTLNECIDSGEALVVELPGQRFVAIQSLEPSGQDDLTDQLLASNASFRDLVYRSRSSRRKPFTPGWRRGAR
jgi:hypothetical protein